MPTDQKEDKSLMAQQLKGVTVKVKLKMGRKKKRSSSSRKSGRR